MIAYRALLACLPGLLAVPLLAQPQIGGGTCSSSTLNGSYSATFTGRDVGTTVTLANVEEAVGSVVFDGLSKVTFSLTTNTSKSFGLPQTLAGAYTMQSNCIGAVSINSGDTASFSLEAYNSGKSYLMIGQNGVYALTANGGLLPTTCASSIPVGTYAFNGTGFSLASAQLAALFNISGLLQISGTNTVTLTAQETTATSGFKSLSSTGTITVLSNCSATANMTDTTGTSYVLTFELTNTAGTNFAFVSSGQSSIFSGTGRSL